VLAAGVCSSGASTGSDPQVIRQVAAVRGYAELPARLPGISDVALPERGSQPTASPAYTPPAVLFEHAESAANPSREHWLTGKITGRRGRCHARRARLLAREFNGAHALSITVHAYGFSQDIIVQVAAAFGYVYGKQSNQVQGTPLTFFKRV
jgi:hypothetical protein